MTHPEPSAPRYTADGRGMLRRDGGMNVLHLRGSDEDMARQHGELLAPEIQAGGLPFMAGFLPAQVASTDGALRGLTSRLTGAALEQLCITVARNAPPELRGAFHALAETAGVPTRTADIAVGTADILLTIVAWMNRLQQMGPLRRGPTLGARGSGLGCSGVVALPEHTASGHLLHGRNMDYDGLGFTDQAPTVAFCRPDRGQAFAWIGSAGLHTTALTAMNEAGVMLGSNTAPTLDVSLRGVPFFALNEGAVRNARTLGEAVDRLSRAGTASGYNVHISHGPSGEAAVVEYAYSQARVRSPEAGFLVATNHYVHPDMAATSPPVSLVDDSNSHGRYERLTALLEAHRGDLTVETLAACMRDTTHHATGESRPLGDVVCNFLNLTSVVADVTAKQFHASAGPAPAAQGPYVMFDLERELDAFGEARAYPLESLPAAPITETPEWEGLLGYQRAHVANAYEHDPERALRHLAEAAAHAPTEPRIALARALVALRLGRLEEATREARRYLATAAPDAPRRYRAHLVRGWCADLEGRRHAARGHYGSARADHPGTTEADRELALWERRAFTHRDRRRLHIDLFNTKRVML